MKQFPEKWAVFTTEENHNILTEWFRKNIKHYKDCKIEWNVGVGFHFHYPQKMSGCQSSHMNNLLGYTEITFEQWKQQYYPETYQIY